MAEAERDARRAEKRYKALYEKEILPALKRWHSTKIELLLEAIELSKQQGRPKREISKLRRELVRWILGEY